MSTRIPSSLKWLINKRARLSGKIQSIERAIEQAALLSVELKNLELTLAQIDSVLMLHEIKVNIEYIRPIQLQKKKIGLPHGELTHSLLSFLRVKKGEPLSTDALTIMLINRFAHLEGTTDGDFLKIRDSVRYRLKDLETERAVVRLPNFFGTRITGWAIPKAAHRA